MHNKTDKGKVFEVDIKSEPPLKRKTHKALGHGKVKCWGSKTATVLLGHFPQIARANF
jgi:hypothetical protein